ncbi:MAG: hypothetical protein K2X66_16670, partial [Cyanobacteria bacterium]|nr:hypothetical protein [Cyanobacteriota bacterium]
MKMMPKKVKYSSKQGVTVEWHRPDEMFLDSSDQVMVWLLLQNYLTWEEMGKHFSPEEQKTIEKYYLQLEKKEHVLLEQLKKKLSVKKLETELRCSLDWWKFCYEGGIKKIMAQMWG